MLNKKNVYIFLIFIIFLFSSFISNKTWACDIIIEIASENDTYTMCLYDQNIERVGIIEKQEAIIVEISISAHYIPKVLELTEQNIGKKLTIRTKTKMIFSGLILEPIKDGIVAFPRDSEEHARATIKEIGKNVDYHLKSSPKDIDHTKSYNKAVTNPYIGKAINAYTSGDYQKAIQYAQKAIRTDPANPLHYLMLSFIYYNQGDKYLSLDKIVQAENLIKDAEIANYPGLFITLGELYDELGKTEEAINCYKKFLLTGNNNLKIRLELARAYEKVGDKKLAIQEYMVLSKSKDEYFRIKGLEGIGRLRN